jgi:hypothetical protein
MRSGYAFWRESRMTSRVRQEGRLYLNGSSSKHVLGAIGWRRLAELSEHARCLLVSSATTAGVAGLKSSDCPFRSAPVIAPSSPQSPPTPFYPSSHDSSEIPKDGCWNRRLLISSTVSDMFGGAELFIIHNMITSVCSSCPENRRQGYVSSPCTNQGPVTPSNSLFTNTAGVKGAIKMHNSF